MKNFFIVIFLVLLTACSPINVEAIPSPSHDSPALTFGSTAASSMVPAIIDTPTSTLTPITTNTGTKIPSWLTQTPLPSIQPGRSFVLTQIHMMDENVGWSVEAAGHLLRTIDGGSTWKSVTPPEVGFYSIGDTMHAWDIVETHERCELLGCSIAWAPGLITWYTSDGGETWQRGSFINDGQPDFRPRAMQFVSHTKGWFLFVYQIGMNGFALESLVRTMDGGESWTHVPFLSNGCISGGMIFVDEQEGWIGDDCRSLSYMLDGIAWQDFLNGKAAPSLHRTIDGGNTWNSFPVPAPTVFPSNLTSRNPDPNVWFYCGIKEMDKISQKAFLLQWRCNTAHSTISAEASYAYLTIDGGQTWHSWLSTGNEHFVNTTIGWRLLTQGEGQSNLLQQTTDGGLAWMTIKAVVWQTAQFDFVSEQVGWAIVSDGKNSVLVHTIDGGKTWTEIKPVIAP